MTGSLLPAASLEALAARALAAGGMRTEDAAEAARILVLADLFGLHCYGVRRIPHYLDLIRAGAIDPLARIRIERAAGAVMRVDGANGLGPLVGSRVLLAAMQAAHGAGVAAAFVRGSGAFGPVMPYCFLAALQGFASIVAASAGATMLPAGGPGAWRGQDPLGIGLPRPGGDPVILDLAPRGTAPEGLAIPTAAAASPTGPVTDPQAALAGVRLALGAAAGDGLGLMLGLLAGALSGAAMATDAGETPGEAQTCGHVVILVDTTRLGAAGVPAGRADALRAPDATPPAAPGAPPPLPGQAEMALCRRQMAEGVAVDPGDLARLEAAAGR